MTTIIPQNIGIGLPIPTYYPVSTPEYIALGPTVFLHLYNDGAVDDAISFIATNPDETGAYHCFFSPLPAGEEMVYGPFDMDTFSPVLLLYHSQPDDVVMAALVPYDIYPSPCVSSSTVMWPTTESTSAVVWPSETAVTKVWCSL